MKHTLRKLLAVVLAVMMVLPMATQAFAFGGLGDGFGGGIGDIGPIETLPFEPEEELPEEEAPAMTSMMVAMSATSTAASRFTSPGITYSSIFSNMFHAAVDEYTAFFPMGT